MPFDPTTGSAALTVPEFSKTGLLLIDWIAVPYADGYELQEAKIPDFSDARIIYTGTAVAYRYNKGRSGTYYYRVRAVKNPASYGVWTDGSNSCEVDLDAIPRPDLYGLLLPPLREEDAKTGTMTYLNHWDSPDEEVYLWDQPDNMDDAVWDKMGLRPVIQRLFWCLEEQEETMLEELESMSDLVNPDRCPARFLGYMASSLGYPLDGSLTEQEQRETIKGIMTAYGEHGTPLSWTVFYRMKGFKIKYYPLWKKIYAEDQDRYNRDRYVTTTAFPVMVLPGTFVNSLPQAPLKPRSLILTDGTEIMRDDGKGLFVGNLGGYGTVNYLTGAMRLHFNPPGPVGPILLNGETVNEEYPYHAARVDLDFFLVPLKGGAPPDVTPEFVSKILHYLDEVRPIHVIIRTFNLVMEIEEELENFVTDGGCCGPSVGVDHWEGEEMYYLGDLGPVPKDTFLHIDTGGTAQQIILDDLTPFIDPVMGDRLVLSSIPSQPFDGQY